MHLGNVYTALLSWLAARSRGGRWVLRIEDLDPQRSKAEFTRLIEDDLAWLGLEPDEGGSAGRGDHGPYMQSLRGEIYEAALERLRDMGMVYPCTCTRADLMATNAPHASDGTIVYGGRCRPEGMPRRDIVFPDRPHAQRLWVPYRTISFVDGICGAVSSDLAADSGDFVLRRADGAWAYQLAVVVDDALMGITEVIRGDDLLMSTPRQLYLYELLGFKAPSFAHLPLLRNAAGQRLSKRDGAMAMDQLRLRYTPAELLGHIAALAGLIPAPRPTSLEELIAIFDLSKIK